MLKKVLINKNNMGFEGLNGHLSWETGLVKINFQMIFRSKPHGKAEIFQDASIWLLLPLLIIRDNDIKQNFKLDV